MPVLSPARKWPPRLAVAGCAADQAPAKDPLRGALGGAIGFECRIERLLGLGGIGDRE